MFEVIVSKTETKIPGEIFARRELSRVTGINENSLEITVNDYGKPLLTNFPDVHFNISHSGNFIVMAIDDEPVGIDVEIIRPYSSRLKIAERFFTADEFYYINSSVCETVSTRRFFEVWTKKESYIKKEGKGLAIPLPSFCVLSFDNNNPVYFHEVAVSDDTVCYVCSATTKHKSG